MLPTTQFRPTLQTIYEASTELGPVYKTKAQKKEEQRQEVQSIKIGEAIQAQQAQLGLPNSTPRKTHRRTPSFHGLPTSS